MVSAHELVNALMDEARPPEFVAPFEEKYLPDGEPYIAAQYQGEQPEGSQEGAALQQVLLSRLCRKDLKSYCDAVWWGPVEKDEPPEASSTHELVDIVEH